MRRKFTNSLCAAVNLIGWVVGMAVAIGVTAAANFGVVADTLAMQAAQHLCLRHLASASNLEAERRSWRYKCAKSASLTFNGFARNGMESAR